MTCHAPPTHLKGRAASPTNRKFPHVLEKVARAPKRGWTCALTDVHLIYPDLCFVPPRHP